MGEHTQTLIHLLGEGIQGREHPPPGGRELLKHNPPYMKDHVVTPTLAVWEWLYRRFESNAARGLVTALAPVVTIAADTGVPWPSVTRSVNGLAALGIVRKVAFGRTGRAQELILLATDPDEVRARWEALGRPSLAHVTEKLVRERLGEDTAASIFRPAAVDRVVVGNRQQKTRVQTPASQRVLGWTAQTSSCVDRGPGEVADTL